jgi:hypothetical protein
VSGNLQVASVEENLEDLASKQGHSGVFLVLLMAGFLAFFVGMILLAVTASSGSRQLGKFRGDNTLWAVSDSDRCWSSTSAGLFDRSVGCRFDC